MNPKNCIHSDILFKRVSRWTWTSDKYLSDSRCFQETTQLFINFSQFHQSTEMLNVSENSYQICKNFRLLCWLAFLTYKKSLRNIVIPANSMKNVNFNEFSENSSKILKIEVKSYISIVGKYLLNGVVFCVCVSEWLFWHFSI